MTREYRNTFGKVYRRTATERDDAVGIVTAILCQRL